MHKLKKNGLLYAGLVLLVINLMTACQNNSGNSNCPPSPKPLIYTSCNDTTFSITLDSVPTADSVRISTFNGLGQQIESFTSLPGKTLKVTNSLNIPRPILVKFVYINASGETVVEDAVRVQEGCKCNDGNGVLLPDMDVVISRTNPQQPCPSLTQFATGLGEVVFTFKPNTWYQVKMAHPGGSEEKLMLRTEATQAGNPGKVNLYNTESFPASCASNPTTAYVQVDGDDDTRKLKVNTVHSTFNLITGLDSISTTYHLRQIKIKCSSDSCTITVLRQR
ncbi:MAG: hypothetical protein ABIQ93_00815 [Saprospiraceae bacterium]